QLEPTLGARWTDPGTAVGLRGLYRVYARGDILRRHAAWSRSGSAVVLFLLLLHGVPGDDVFVVLDSLQQLLDAGSARPRCCRREDCPGGLVGDHDRADRAGEEATHAASRVPDDRYVRGGYGRVVPSTRKGCAGSGRDVALGPRVRC